MTKTFNTKAFLSLWKQRKDEKRKEKEEWLFAIAVVKAGLEREGNFDTEAKKDISDALAHFNITPAELQEYLENNRALLLQFLDSSTP